MTKPRGIVALDVSGLGAFALDAAGGRRFKKEVLRAGHWIHPATGEDLDFDRAFLERLVKDTARWIDLGNKVWFPAGHTTDVRANLGFWPRFELEGERLVGQVDVLDEQAARNVGKTIQDVSAAIHFGAVASTGETFEAVIEHVAATPEPVIPGQTNFVRLAREAGRNQVDESDLAPLRAALGLAKDATPSTIVEAVNALKTTPPPAPPPAPSAPHEDLEKLSREIEAKVEAKFSKQLADLRHKAAEREVELAREESIRSGCPIDEETRKDAVSLLARGDPESERLGRRLLALAKAPRDTKALRTLPSPSEKKDEEKEKDKEEVRKQMLLARGYRLELRKDGTIKRAIPPHAHGGGSPREED
jgi:hypothetical protein